MSSQLPNGVLANFRKLRAISERVEASTGAFFFPPAGENTSRIVGMVINPDAKIKNSGTEIPGITIEFNYELQNPDPSQAGSSGQKWRGKPFDLPNDPAFYAIAPGKKGNRFEIEVSRLKGHLYTILDVTEGEIDDLLPLAYAKVNDPASAVIVKAYCVHSTYTIRNGDRAGQEGTDRYEKLQELVMS